MDGVLSQLKPSDDTVYLTKVYGIHEFSSPLFAVCVRVKICLNSTAYIYIVRTCDIVRQEGFSSHKPGSSAVIEWNMFSARFVTMSAPLCSGDSDLGNPENVSMRIKMYVFDEGSEEGLVMYCRYTRNWETKRSGHADLFSVLIGVHQVKSGGMFWYSGDLLTKNRFTQCPKTNLSYLSSNPTA